MQRQQSTGGRSLVAMVCSEGPLPGTGTGRRRRARGRRRVLRACGGAGAKGRGRGGEYWPNEAACKAELKEGSRMEGIHKNRCKWYSGRVLGVRPSHTLDAAFDQQSGMTHVERIKVEDKGAEAS